MPEPLDIDIQATPNPNAIKFTLNRTVAAGGITYRDAATADAAWAKQVLQLASVAQVFAMNNFISVTKASDAAWDTITPQVEQILRQHFG